MEKLQNKNIIWVIKIMLLWIMIISITIEIIFFPTVGNLAGCIMMIISYSLFANFFLKRDLIINAPFSFFMLCSMFLYRYLPLVGTLLEGKPISYGMENPVKTFFLETILFSISCIAFYFSSKNIKKVNFLQKTLNTFGFYNQSNEKTLWLLGGLGFIARIISFSMGSIETGNVIGRILYVLYYYMYAPVILFFPCLYISNSKKNFDTKNKVVWIYIIIISIFNFASNSRNELITPFSIFILLLFFVLVITNISMEKLLKPKIIIKTLIICMLSFAIINMISKSMLINRSVREELSFTELIESTFDTLISGNMEATWESYSNKVNTTKTYEEGWTEDYIDNFLLNRFCNIRITDETLYLSGKLDSYGQIKMLQDFSGRITAILPQPVIKFIGLNFNKENYYNSRGDTLYIYSGIGNSNNWGGYRVTSHLGDGLATFGIFYFIIQFIMWYIVMSLLNSFSIYTKKMGRIYSVYGVLSVYASLLMFRNANGMISDILYFLRGYWQDVIIFLIIYNFTRFISSIKFER